MTLGTDAQNRLAYLADTVDLLWPGINGSGPDGPMAVVPSERTPRLLVPIRTRSAAAAAVRRYTAQQGVRERAAGLALAAAIRSGICERMVPVSSSLPAGESISQHLANVLGRPVVTALALTHARPNRKPVLQAFDERGTTLAFAKIGVSPLAAQLVTAEAETLSTLAGRRLEHVLLPRVLDHSEWHGMPVLVTSPLPLRRAPRMDDEVLLAAMRDVSRADHAHSQQYVTQLQERAAAVGSTAEQWCHVLGRVLAARDVTAIPMGAWHGDFTQWNCARVGRRVAIWDWERFASPAPAGFDRLHYRLNHDVRARRHHFRAAATQLISATPHLLRPWALDVEQARTVGLLYLLDIALRYLRDDLRATDPGGQIEQWAFPVIEAALAARDTDPR